MAFKGFYTVEKEINGEKYVAQFNGLNAMLDALDECHITGSTAISNGELYRYILDNVIVSPKGLTPDKFKDFKELNAVIKFGYAVMRGDLRDEPKVESTAK